VKNIPTFTDKILSPSTPDTLNSYEPNENKQRLDVLLPCQTEFQSLAESHD
jgi:hypothetical protein